MSLSLYEPVVFRLLAEDDPCLSDVKRLATSVRQLCAAERRDLHRAASGHMFSCRHCYDRP